MSSQSQTIEPIHFSDLTDKIDGKNPLLGEIFLFFLVCFTFLLVYFIYTCIRDRDRHRRSVGNLNSPPARPASGLDTDTISGLPMFSYGSWSCSSKKPTSSPGAECAICLNTFQEGDRVKVLPMCRHGFHSDCVDKWLRTRSSCPLCRSFITRVDPLGQEPDTVVP